MEIMAQVNHLYLGHSGIYSPSQGSLKVVGKVNSLNSLNAGFNENLTGYENCMFKLKLWEKIGIIFKIKLTLKIFSNLVSFFSYL